MQKIPTLFVRDFDSRPAYVTHKVTPGCEWVLAGEGVPTHKYDGTCVMFDGTAWWARREVRADRTPPPHYLQISHDENTGKSVGWEPIAQSQFVRFHAQALAAAELAEVAGHDEPWPVGTYELIGPKINGNPEKCDKHWLIAHANAVPLPVDELTFDGIRDAVLQLNRAGVEGLVWHHPDGRMAKIKAKDFRPGTDA